MPSGRPGEGKAEDIWFDWWRYLEAFGDRLREKRERLGLTQQRIAEKVGVRQATVSRIEAGLEAPKNYAVAKAISVCYGLGETEEREWFELLVPIPPSPHTIIVNAAKRIRRGDVPLQAASSLLLPGIGIDLLNWEDAAQIIRRWLSSDDHSIDRLASEAGTAIMSHAANQENVGNLGQEVFAKESALLPLILALNPGALLASNVPRFDVTTMRPYEVGARLLTIGDALAKRSWEEALPWFRAAETMFGPASSQAARAALEVAQILMYLGDYGGVRTEISRVSQSYGAVLDPETKTELYRIRGWLEYYEGHFAQSVKWLSKNIALAQEMGMSVLGDRHFLGRVYTNWGQMLDQPRASNNMFAKAESQLDESYRSRLHSATDWDLAYDLFRKAQLKRLQRRGYEADHLRERACRMFGRDAATFHIDLEEARLALEEGETRKSRRKAKAVLVGWEQVKYAKGAADALRFLGELEYRQGNSEKALGFYLSALCVYPFENHPNNRLLRVNVERVRHSMDKNTYQKQMRRFQELARNQEGSFSTLRSISVDRSEDIARIFARMA